MRILRLCSRSRCPGRLRCSSSVFRSSLRPFAFSFLSCVSLVFLLVKFYTPSPPSILSPPATGPKFGPFLRQIPISIWIFGGLPVPTRQLPKKPSKIADFPVLRRSQIHSKSSEIMTSLMASYFHHRSHSRFLPK